MRPLHLSLEGFMAFREATELDLSHCDIFVLTGPTGAGKSSLLDALSFALYGETPRIGPKELKKLIYQDIENPRTVAKVSLSFRHQQQDYRILRQLSDSGQRVELESRKSPEAPWETHTVGKVSEFKQLMPRLLGLDFKAFSRVLMLPQGGFDHFLKQDGAKERRALLLHLAQLDAYEAIQVQADLARRKAEQQQNHLKGQLSGLGEVSAEQQQNLKQALSEAEHSQQRLKTEAAERSSALAKAESLWQDLQDLQALKAEQAALVARQTEMAALEGRIKSGQALRELGAEFRQWRSLQDRQQRWQQENQALQIAGQGLQHERAELQTALAGLARALADLPAHEARLQQLQHLQPELRRWQRLRQEHHKQTQAYRQAESQLKQTHQEIDTLSAQQQSAQTQMEILSTELSQLQIDADRLELLHQIGPELKLLQLEKQAQAAELTHQAQQLAAEVSAQQTREQQLQTHCQAQEQLYSKARQRTAEAVQAHEDLQRQSQVKLLRQHLQAHPEADCPVCLQPVSVPPPVAADTDLATATDTLQRSREAETAAQQALQTATQALAVLASETRSTQQQAQVLQSRLQTLKAEIQQQSESLRQALQLSAREALPDWMEIKEEFTALRQQRQQARQSETQLHSQRENLLQLQNRLALARQTAQLQEDRLQELHGLLQQTGAESEALHHSLAALLKTESDFEQAHRQQLEQLDADIQALRQQQADLEQRRQAMQHQEIQHQSKTESLQRQGQDIQEELKSLTERLEEACQALAYPGIAAAEADLPAAEVLQGWQHEVRQYHSQQLGLLQNIEPLQVRIGGQSLSESELNALRLEVQADQLQLQGLSTQIALLQRDLEQARHNWQQALDWREALADIEHELGLYQRIYHDLGSRQLPDFLAKRILERVISGGSQELERLSQGRYRFELDTQEELVILDAWNAHEPRSVKTLSGGESFLASLALALALNTWLAGGIQLDSLFIDEGFGTLDTESLEQAAQVIESLQLSGKCVGIITHIPELAERFEHRLQVHKSDLGARLEWH